MNKATHCFDTRRDVAVPFHQSEGWWRCWTVAFGGDALRPVELGAGTLRMMLLKKKLGPFRFRSLQSATNLDTCYYDAPAAVPADELAMLPERLFEMSNADKLRFDWLRDGSSLLAAAEGWRERHAVTIERYATSSVVDCRQRFEDYLARAGKTVKKYWRTCRREVIGGGCLEVEFVTGGCRVADTVAEMLALEASGWKGREGSAILNDPGEAAFYTALASAAAEAGALRLALLREEGRLIAFEYCIVSDGTVLALKVGYDEARARLQPGHVLALMNIRDACGRPELHFYDMLGNSNRIADYKRRFATDYWTISRIRVYGRSPAGRLLYAAMRVRARLKALRNRTRYLADRRAAARTPKTHT
jgi:CelD/BcsL family acetyltransferase involved in cellulose biosynthesis